METARPTFRPATERLFTRPGFLLRRLHQISVGMFEEACKSLSLTPTQYGTMVIVNALTDQDQSSVARQLGLDKVTVMRVLKGLEERGLLVRKVNASDRRQYFVSLTAEGKAVLDEANGLAEAVYEKLLSPVPEQERERLIDLLQSWAQDLEPFARVAMERHRK
ncbi:MAG: MarR family transcriptional regulator [Pigmentiphaga sp.]|nr:MarR family transcriptional regulator [Pigmentiphaga sp.]